MVDVLSAILGISFAAGFNAYATVLGLGVMHRLGWIVLPPGLEMASSAPVLAVAAFLYLVEFVADKVPFIDSVWDAIHTVIRPLAGAVMAYGIVGSVAPEWQLAAALVGGSVALTSHTAKASTRAAVNVSPEPVSNWMLSLFEDGLAFFLVWLTSSFPLIALVIVVMLVIAAVYLIWRLSHLVRWVFRKSAQRKPDR
jgi:hypothetical protein